LSFFVKTSVSLHLNVKLGIFLCPKSDRAL
jgi:hypothetical protein